MSGRSAGVAALEDLAFADASRAHNDMWLAWLTRELQGLGLEVLPSVGNFVLVHFKPGAKGAAEANAFLNSRAIIPRGLDNYGLPDYLRITVGTEAEMRAVVAALADFLK